MAEPITLFCADSACLSMATELSKTLELPLCDRAGAEDSLTLRVDGDGLTLCGYRLSYRGDYTEMLPRLTGGRLAHEMLVHAAKTKAAYPTAIDATAGMGEDSLLLAAAGYEVTLLEKDPVIAALLRDTLSRAAAHPVLGEIVGRMHLVQEDSVEWMPAHPGADLIYLDPMFPARHKSSLIGKKLQLLQHLERPCPDERALFDAAIAADPRKLIIKRPLKGATLADCRPQYTIKGKAIRYDCFVFPK